jgi:hypothetical protein
MYGKTTHFAYDEVLNRNCRFYGRSHPRFSVGLFRTPCGLTESTPVAEASAAKQRAKFTVPASVGFDHRLYFLLHIFEGIPL